ncbi:MAG: hypothetical protein AAF799_04325 [Myxococcota bacterium]
MQTRRTKHEAVRLGSTLILFTMLGTFACSHAAPQPAEELLHVAGHERDLHRIRVRLDRRLSVLYVDQVDDDDDEWLVETSAYSTLTEVTTPRTLGMVWHVESIPQGVRAWVTFDPRCQELACCQVFVSLPDGSLALARVHSESGFGPPEVYRGARVRRNQMHRVDADAAEPVYRTASGHDVRLRASPP